MKIVINSHTRNYIALEHLLESMKIHDEFKLYETIIVIGGYNDSYSKYHIQKDENITYIKCNHNSMDFTGLLTLLDLYNKDIDEYYFYLHDTCKVGLNFYKKLKLVSVTNVTSMKINFHFSMNIGIYSQKIINQFKDFLLTTKNEDESRTIEFKWNQWLWEDYIFKNDPNVTILDNYFSYWNPSGPFDYYKTGNMRIIEYYPNIDLYKMKANYGVSNVTIISN